MLGVTATPLSSNINLPMKDNYDELIVGESISELIKNKFLAKADLFTYNVGLTSLIVGANGDYTVKSSEELYTNNDMLSKLMIAYQERCLNKRKLNRKITKIKLRPLVEDWRMQHWWRRIGNPLVKQNNNPS